ncbi:MAG TPA: hemolysin family protein, partial [Gemmatimonadales bacterium]|nr:hemolysin family protein [Gemmatimonadales bacterium]
MDIGLRLAVVLALVAANGFFVAAEFALVTARKTRIEQLAARGNKAAVAVRRAMDDPNRFISACQLGITMASLALGWIGEATIASLLEPPFASVIPANAVGLTSHAVAVPLAFAAITFLHITLGEQVPKMLALQKGEATALFAIQPTNFLGIVFRPFIRLLEAFTNLVLRALGMEWQAEMHQAYSVEDLKLIIQSSRAAGSMGEDPDKLVERALDFAGLAARHLMVPRTEMIAIPSDVTLERLAEVMERHQHSRYPVFEASPDNIVGVLSSKNLAAALARAGQNGPVQFDARSHMSAPLFVPETMRADMLLAELKQRRSHLAVVIDEYGVTAGLVTLRDLMDRIAGEVPDEAEVAPPMVEWLPDGSARIDGL